jgi:hypothetical protein
MATIGTAIAEALVVTGYGLMVAIPSVLLFNWLSRLISKYESGLTHARHELVDHLAGDGATGAGDTGDGELDPDDLSRAPLGRAPAVSSA